MPRSHVLPTLGLLVVVFVTTAGQSHAQEVKWRDDYAAARREATETGKPLLFDFGTEACVWCRKLDATTFRDPASNLLLNLLDAALLLHLVGQRFGRGLILLRVEESAHELP